MLSDFIYNIKKMALIKKICLVIIPIIIITSIVIINSFKKDVKEEEVFQEPIQIEAKKVTVPDVDEINTKITLSSTDEVENVTITVEDCLDDYVLYYFIKTNADIVKEESEQIEDIKESFSAYIKYESPIFIEENSKIFFVYEKDGDYSENKYIVNIDNIVKKLQGDVEVTEEELKKEKVAENKVVTGTAAYYIRVNYGANVVTIYGKDEEGNYTKPVKAMICSCGISTPKGGVYKTSRGYDWGALIGGVYGQYSTRIVGSILFHSVPYTSRSKSSLEYWEFDKLGTKASAGCVRLQVVDAKWIFNNCGSGVMVEFYSSSDPGPLGKPSAPKISGNERCRNWDPTDYVPGNPWLEKDTVSQPVQPEIKPTEPIDNNSKVPEPTNSVDTTNTVLPPIDNTTIDNIVDNNTTTDTTTSTDTVKEKEPISDTTSTDTTPKNTTPSNTTTPTNKATNNEIPITTTTIDVANENNH